MSKIGTITLTGASGNKYEFNIYPFGTEFNDIGAVYYISKRTVKADCFSRYGANCISTHREDNEENRLSIESDLIEAYKPPCNG